MDLSDESYSNTGEERVTAKSETNDEFALAMQRKSPNVLVPIASGSPRGGGGKPRNDSQLLLSSWT